MNRQEHNRKITELLAERILGFKDSKVFKKLEDLVELYPDQRFGQILCNYICLDYREGEISELTKTLLTFLFQDISDPFFEESIVTYHRLLLDNVL